ncbi:MAG: hypothetical protein AAGH89_02660 [Verrucomicrobiota bacterium]
MFISAMEEKKSRLPRLIGFFLRLGPNEGMRTINEKATETRIEKNNMRLQIGIANPTLVWADTNPESGWYCDAHISVEVSLLGVWTDTEPEAGSNWGTQMPVMMMVRMMNSEPRMMLAFWSAIALA